MMGTAAASAVPDSVDGLYGPEFTFTVNGNVSRAEKENFIEHLKNHLIENQPPGAKFKTGSISVKFVSPNGWWFLVKQDPGVIEITMSPLTVRETRKYLSDIQDAIFVSAANCGLFPWDFLGGGHLNIDYRVFNNRILLARNFIVDFWNHNELAMGIMNFDTRNAFPFVLYDDAEKQKMMKLIARADAGEFPDTAEGVQQFFESLSGSRGYTMLNRAGNSPKNNDLNFRRSGRVELRALRPQKNMAEWLNQIELIESRINNHLRFLKEPIPLKFKVPLKDPSAWEALENDQLYVPPIDPQQALRAFYQYVTESGLEWKNHVAYIWPAWVEAGELQKFECELALNPTGR